MERRETTGEGATVEPGGATRLFAVRLWREEERAGRAPEEVSDVG
jgi:hypothetical protein